MTAPRDAYPADFRWGAATSSHQIEGSTSADGRGPSIWDTFAAVPGNILDGTDGRDACDHYRRFRDDVELMRSLGLNAYRFSISWSRILPTGTGAVNEDGLQFYEQLVDALLAAGIEPLATLYHWDLPQPLEDAGGWPNRDTADAFVTYVDIVTQRLGDRVSQWITLNEPWVAAWHGYGDGAHAPGRASNREFLAAAHTMLVAHGRAVDTIRRNVPDAKVGIALNLMPTWPADAANDADVAAARRYDGYVNRWFLDPVHGRGYPADLVEWWGDDMPTIVAGDLDIAATPTDFLGINYYFTKPVAAAPGEAPVDAREVVLAEREYTDMQWLVDPDGIRDLILRLYREYGISDLRVTENGCASVDSVDPTDGKVHDEQRMRYLQSHLAAGAEAIEQGAPLTGWYVWSLLDNYEWGFGYSKRFGIVRVDYDTFERIPKDSAQWYRAFISAGACDASPRLPRAGATSA